MRCCDEEYCSGIYAKTKFETNEIDLWYVWSFSEAFVKGIGEKRLVNLVNLVKQNKLSDDAETKLYAILNNVARFTQHNIADLPLSSGPKSVKALFNYLKLVST